MKARPCRPLKKKKEEKGQDPSSTEKRFSFARLDQVGEGKGNAPRSASTSAHGSGKESTNVTLFRLIHYCPRSAENEEGEKKLRTSV